MEIAVKDKLTKKRVKVDYHLVIAIAKKQDEFLNFLKSSESKISFNRKAYNFCKHAHIDVDAIYGECLSLGLRTYDEYMAYWCKIANTPWLED